MEVATYQKTNRNSSEPKPCLSGRGITKIFGVGKTQTVAVDHVDFDFNEGEIISIVGESGSGKTTLSKMLLGLISTTEGSIEYQGKPRDISSTAKKKEYWKNIQPIFQDPFSSYNIFYKIDAVLDDCLNMRGFKNLPEEQKIQMKTEACSFVNLKYAELTNKYPFELSGGQCQRVAIARAVINRPDILFADEPTGSVDSEIAVKIMRLFVELNKVGTTVLIATHNEQLTSNYNFQRINLYGKTAKLYPALGRI